MRASLAHSALQGWLYVNWMVSDVFIHTALLRHWIQLHVSIGIVMNETPGS